MTDRLAFQTPENIQVAYEPAGLGSRFIAWLVDSIFNMLIMIALLLMGVFFSSAFSSLLEDRMDIDPYIIGIATVIYMFSVFIYFGMFEHLLSGQTPGKMIMKLRVVKADGFSLDGRAVFIRTLFRVLDHMPPLWIVVLVSQNNRRFGDMVAGTVVVSEKMNTMSTMREVLLNRDNEKIRFAFTPAQVSRIRSEDMSAIEKILERSAAFDDGAMPGIYRQACDSIAKRLETDSPQPEYRQLFLQDLLTAVYRRQYRSLD